MVINDSSLSNFLIKFKFLSSLWKVIITFQVYGSIWATETI